MPPLPTVAVIIPTYNRKEMLQESLNSLAQQSYPSDRLEAIVVDDGSTDGTEAIADAVMPFQLRYFWQRNQGDAAARNFGTQQTQADILVFLDDDILLEPGYISQIIEGHGSHRNRIVVGTWNLWQAETSPFSRSISNQLPTGDFYARAQTAPSSSSSSDPGAATIEIPFRDAYSNNMSIGREAYFSIGMMEGLDFSGSSMWCDLDFAYRAHRQGFEFRRSTRAFCWHRDYAVRDLNTYKKRVRIAAFRSVVLFRKYPELLAYVPMFYDKTPIIWGQDPPRLIARKIVRSMASSPAALWSMEQIADLLETRHPASGILPSLYRYIIGGHIFQGYRAGLNGRASFSS
jgi:glycosyltransferase involved in cell wall biosynthesis